MCYTIGPSLTRPVSPLFQIIIEKNADMCDTSSRSLLEFHISLLRAGGLIASCQSLKMVDCTPMKQDVLQRSQTSFHDSTTCEVCRGIWTCLLNPETRLQVTLGHTDKPVSCDCPGHSPLVSRFLEISRLYELEETDASVSSDEEDASDTGHIEVAERDAEAVEIHRGPRTNELVLRRRREPNIAELMRVNSLGWGVFDQPLVLLKKDSVPGHRGTGLELDPDWIDLQLARHWKEKCLEQHGTRCNNPLKVSPVRPFWVVDVEGECIIPGRDCAAFVALSYRWGNHSWPAVDQEMLTALRKPGALATAHLAPIVRHAMSLTLALGERFLWVDALCVVQGDNTGTKHQLNLMGAFYASALLTIVVANGDSVTGIQGLKGVSSSREAKQALIPFGEETLIFPQTHICLGEYDTRGWTYQEYIMSQRRLIFAGQRMHWECPCCDWHEEVICTSEIYPKHLFNEPDRNLIFRGLPDNISLERFIRGYNSCDFTYQEDVLPGISGLLSLASRSFTGGFLCGLPEMFFDRALGWAGSGDLRRRVASGRPEEQRLSHSLGILPSWSWIGWEGGISRSLQPVEAIEISRIWGYWLTEETVPITDWYALDTADGTALRKINSVWFENRDARYKDLTRPLLGGWTRRKIADLDYMHPGQAWCPPGCDEYVFQHQLCPDRLWYYPFPITEVQGSAPHFMPEQTPYLFCKTHRARLWAVCSVALWEAIERKSDFHGTGVHQAKTLHALEIRIDRHGPPVGELYLHSMDQLAPFLVSSGNYIKTGPGESVELVAIYRSLVHESIHRGPSITQERYRVLWVEWEKGIAYRLGVGWVEKAAWEGVNPTEIDLVLG